MSSYRCGICHQEGHNRRTCPLAAGLTAGAAASASAASATSSSDQSIETPLPPIASVASLFILGDAEFGYRPPSRQLFPNHASITIGTPDITPPGSPQHSQFQTPPRVTQDFTVATLESIFDPEFRVTQSSSGDAEGGEFTRINIETLPPPSCVICMEPLVDQPQTELLCHHTFCTSCIMTNLEHGNLNCPMCRTEVKKPSNKVAALERENAEQHRELCEMDDTMQFHRGKFKSYEANIECIQRQVKRYKDVGASLEQLLNLSSWPSDSDSDTTIMCLEEFRDSLSLEYKRYIEHFYQSQRSPTTAPPTLEHMIFSLFTRKGHFDHLSTDEKHEILVLRDCHGVILSPDCWIKIGEGKYRNHMARLIWKCPMHTSSGHYVVRIYRGLGKPKLSQGVYDCSYTTDIKLQEDTDDDEHLEGGTEECVITPDMLTRVPDDAVTFTVKGNSVSLPKDVRKQLRANKINLVLNRVAVL